MVQPIILIFGFWFFKKRRSPLCLLVIVEVGAGEGNRTLVQAVSEEKNFQ